MSGGSRIHQHLSVAAADSSGSGHYLDMVNTVDSPTSDTSPSLRAPSTDQDYDIYRSSPSTSFTSASTSACDSDDAQGEGGGQGGECEVGSNTKTRRQVDNIGQAIQQPSRTWKMPFAKSSAPPRALSTAIAGTGLSSNNRSSPPRRNKQSSSPSKLSFNAKNSMEYDNYDDGSFVETTSEKAAQALANYWNDVQAHSDVNGRGMSKVATSDTVNDYVVVARVENGKRIYKIRPRSRPTAPLQEGHVQLQPPQSSINKLQPLAPSSTASSSNKTKLQMPPSIRLTKSIPNLRTRSNSANEDGGLLSIMRDKDGFYRPSGGGSTQPDNAYLTLPLTSGHHVLRIDDDDPTPQRSRKSTLQTASSIPNLRANRDQDVFGKLLGWQSEDSPQYAAVIPTSSPTKRHPQTGKKGSTSPPASRSPERLQQERNSPIKSNYEDVHTPINESFPYQLAPSLQEISCSSIDSHRDMPAPSTSSPFGHGVRLPSQPRLKRKKSIQQLHGTIMAPQSTTPNEESGNNTFDSYDSFDTSIKIRSLREVGSSETIRTARAVPITTPVAEQQQEQETETEAKTEQYSATQQRQFPESPRTPMAIISQRDAWLSDTRIYDDLQVVLDECQTRSPELRDSLKPTSEGAGRRHERGMSNTSLVSLGGSSLHSTNSAASAGEQAHTITVTNMPGDDRRFVIWGRRPGPPMPRTTSMRPASNARMSPASLSSSGAHSSLGSSKRSSFQRKHDSSATELSTPPTSASSPSSPWSSSGSSPPVQKVLLAATVDRWIAQMTSEIENDLMTDFFFTYRSFLSPLALCKLLITRFEWALQPGNGAKDAATRRIVRVRTYVVIRHWILNYFHEDFVPDRELRTVLTAWLNRMGKCERLRPNPTDLRLIKSLKKVVKRLKAAYSTIGIDQATDANTLIKTSLEEADAHHSRTRGRSDSMASMSSLHSIREEQSELPPPVRSSSQEIHSNTPPSALSNSDGSAGHLQRKDMRTSSSEDDVDLEIEMHLSGYDSDELPRIPPFIPISPPRARHQSPLHQRKSRSPQLGSYERNSMALDGMPAIADSHRVSRAIASTVGSFSKLRRMMGTRRAQPTSNAPKYYNDAASDMSQFGAFAPNDEPEGLFRTSTMLSRNVSGHPSGEDKASGLGIYNEETASPASSSTPSATPSSQDLRHSASNGTMRRKPSRPNLLRVATSSSSDGASASKQKQSSPSPAKARLAPAANIRMSGIQLDDCDSSGDESNVGDQPPLRTLRRLPAARDLRGGKGPTFNSLAHRHSIDSIASYATRRLPSCALEPIRIPSIATYDSNSSAHDQDRDALATQSMIPFFVLPTDSEDEDEPGDVQAALRRLEGQIDTEKQRSNAQRVERYLKMSEEAKANGGYIYGDNDDQSDEDNLLSSRPPSAAISFAFDNTAEVAAVQKAHTQEALETPLQALEAHPLPKPHDTTQAESLAVPNAIAANGPGKRTIQRKSSMRRFFGSTMSVSLWPSSNSSGRSTKSKIFQPPPYRSFLFSHKIEALARHFCIIERDLLEKVTWQELISSMWRERLDIEEVMDWDSFMKIRAKLNSEVQGHQFFTGSALTQPKRVGDVQTIIHRFNLMCRWIASEIVLTTSTAERALLLTKIIKLALKSYYIYNFQTVTQIVHALQLPSIERLKKTWSKVPSFEMKLFDKLKLFCSPLRDFRLLREATGALALQWGPPGQEEREPDMQGIPGALPFFGLILRDLAISKELPTFLDPSNPRAPADIDEDSMLLPEYADPSEFSDLPPLPEGLPLRPLINIHKYRTIAKTIQLVMTFKELAGTYPYEPELTLYRKCLTIQCLPMDKIVELSTACER